MNKQVKKLIDQLKISIDRNDVEHYHPYYFYYTTLSTLAAMLVNHRIKMSDVRSDRINDMREPREFCDEIKWKRTRICCFASGWMENNAMWGCYGHPKDEAIVLRIPAGLMADLSSRPISYRNKASRVKLDWSLLSHPELCDKIYRPLAPSKRSLHDVAYFGGLSRVDDEEREDLQIGFHRGDRKLEKPMHIVFKNIKEIDPLVGYVKRIQWQYENESRIHIEVRTEDANREVYLNLPQDFFKRTSIVLGPDFDLENESIRIFPRVSARDVLEEFLCQSDGGRKGRNRIIESAFFRQLNYSGCRMNRKIEHLSLMHDGVEAITRSARQDPLYKRFLELSAQ